MWDRISQIVLIVFGLLVLVVLTIGLAISCREQPPSPEEGTGTAVALTLTAAPGPTLAGSVTPGGPVDPNASPTPTAIGGATADPNASPTATLIGGPTIDPNATPTPTPFGGATVDPNATATATIVGGATPVVPNATPTATPIGGVTPGGPGPTLPATPIGGATPGGPGPTPTPALSPGSGLTPGSTVQHTVGRGDWLLQIARCYGADYDAIRAANRFGNPDFILPGAVITVPNIGSEGRIIGPPCVQAYAVQAGDTWELLAARYGTTAAILQRANPGGLVAGRQIWVPRL